VNAEGTNFVFFGIVPIIFRDMTKRFNFTDAYQPGNILSIEDFVKTKTIKLIHINGSYKKPNVYFDVFQIQNRDVMHHTTTTFIQSRVKLLITPEEPYTIYEKLLLPFDDATWISIIVTFLIAFLAVFVINFFSNKIQELVYGKGVLTPTLNILGGFFGISQTVLPVANFPRILFTVFISFCLIIRTCYQSKLFEFMTTLMRRPPPQTLQDLIDRNYTIYTYENYDIYSEMIADEIR
jgi:hypothetical protein